MAYIGREPQIGNFQVCDAISTVNNQAAYTMQVGGVNVSPETANHMLVSLNGILQAPTSSFTVSGSTITFASNLVTGDVINFIQILGSVLDLGVPSDSTVSLAKLTATGTKNSTTFLRGDNTFAVAGESNTPYFNAKMTGTTDNFSDGALYTINNYNSVPIDTCSGFTTSTGRYLPDVAGYYYFEFQTHISIGASNMKMCYGQIFKNGSGGSSYSERRIQQITFNNNYGSGASVNVSGIFYMNGSSDYIYSAVVGDSNSGADANIAGESNYTWISGFLIAAT
jgi:hypothetical protein